MAKKLAIFYYTIYEIDGLEEIKKYISKWNIREEENREIILTDVMDIYIIELPKFKKYSQKKNNSALNSWIKFIESPEAIDMKESSEEVKKAKEILEEISSDKREIYLAELREKYILDQNDIKAQGVDEGIKIGIEKGKKEGTISIAKKLKEQNVDIEIISKSTGLSIEEIKKL